MRIVLQRVLEAKVGVGSEVVGQIGQGLLIYLGVGKSDTEDDAKYIAGKITGLRVFSDNEGKMNLSVKDVGGEILLVSQFTLYGDCRKGRRPGFDLAGAPSEADRLYQYVGELLVDDGVNVKYGRFAAHMHVSSINDGPVTFLLDSPASF